MVLKRSLKIGGVLFLLATAQSVRADVGEFSITQPSPVDLHLSYAQIQQILKDPTADTAPMSVTAATHPSWQNETLGHVNFNYFHDQRTNGGGKKGSGDGKSDFDIYKLNENGTIKGQELIDLAHPAEGALFEQVMRSRGKQGDLHGLYKDYLSQLTDQGMALLTLNRILDNEAMKAKLPPEVSDARVSYVLRAILTQNAENLESQLRDFVAAFAKAHNRAPVDTDFIADTFPAGTKPTAAQPIFPRDLVELATKENFVAKGTIGYVADYDAPIREAVLALQKSNKSHVASDADLLAQFAREDIDKAVASHAISSVNGGYSAVEAIFATSGAGGLPNQTLYPWLQQVVGSNSVRFNIDWSFADGMQAEKEALRSDHSELSWPSVTLPFQKLSDTWQDFQQQIRDKLQPSHRQILRQTIWQALVQANDPNLNWQAMFSVTTNALSEVYASMKETNFKAQAQDASVANITISGDKAKDFEQAFNLALQARQDQLTQQLLGAAGGASSGGAATDGDGSKLRGQVSDLRKTVPFEVYTSVVTQFAQAIAAGQLHAAFARDQFHFDGITAPAADATDWRSQEQASVFNPMFAAMQLFPKLESTDNAGIHFMLLETVADGAVTYVDMHDARVEQLLRQKIMGKTQGLIFRDLVEKLFIANRFETETDTCRQPEWPCIGGGAHDDERIRRWTNAIFPETLYPNRSLPSNTTRYDHAGREIPAGLASCDDYRGNATDLAMCTASQKDKSIPSTLGHPELQDRVLDISLELFSKVFEIPNN